MNCGPALNHAASRRALQIHSRSYQTVKNILASGMDRCPPDDSVQSEIQLPQHENIRGADYYGLAEETA